LAVARTMRRPRVFFGGLKRERVNRRQYRTRADIFNYIECWHNPRQRRQLAFEQQADKLLTQLRHVPLQYHIPQSLIL
jgi:hypothetical protein